MASRPGSPATPPYPRRHKGTLLIVGSAPNLMDDLAAASHYRPSAHVMAINEAAGVVKAHFIASQHPDVMLRFAGLQEAKFGRHGFTTHSGFDTHGQDPRQYPAVNYWWPRIQCGATSAWAGVRIARMMGFDEVILCGCPMNGGDGYFMPTLAGSTAQPRFGFLGPEKSLVKSFKENLAAYARSEGDGVYSMSGYTGEVLGLPPDIRRDFEHGRERHRHM